MYINKSKSFYAMFDTIIYDMSTLILIMKFISMTLQEITLVHLYYTVAFVLLVYL